MSVEISGWVTGPTIFGRVPKSAEAIATVIGVGAAIEYEWVQILAMLTHAEVDVSVVLWQSLRGVQAQQKAMLEIANLKLNAPEVALMKKVMKGLERHRKMRDRFAHGLWAQSLTRNDELILLTGRTLAAFATKFGRHGDIFDMTLTIDDQDIFGAEQFRQVLEEANRAQQAIGRLASHFLVQELWGLGDRQAAFDRTEAHIAEIWPDIKT